MAENWADYWESLKRIQEEENAGYESAPMDPPTLSGAAYQQDPVGTGPAQGDQTRDDYGQPIVTHYNPNQFATNDTAQQWAQQLGGEVISAPSREAGGGTPGSPWTMPDANYIRMPNGSIVNSGQLQQYVDAFGPKVGMQMVQQEIAGSTPEGLAAQGAHGSDYWYDQYRDNAAVAPPVVAPPPVQEPPPSRGGNGDLWGREGGVPGSSRGAGFGDATSLASRGTRSLPSESADAGVSLSGRGGGEVTGRGGIPGSVPTGDAASGRTGGGTVTDRGGIPGLRDAPNPLAVNPPSQPLPIGGDRRNPPATIPPPGGTGNPATPNPVTTGPRGGGTTPPPPPPPPPPPGGRTPPPGGTGQPGFPGTTGMRPPGAIIPGGPNPLFPNWNTGDGTNGAYLGGDPGFMASALQNRALDYGNRFENDYGNAYGDAQTQARQYQDQGDEAYNWLNDNPGYNAEEAEGITQQGRLTDAMTTDSEFDSNQLTDAERQGMMGDAGAVGRAFNPRLIADTSKAGTDWTRGTYENSYQAAKDALKQGETTANATLGDYGSRLRGAYGNMSGNVNSALDASDKGISDNLATTRQGYNDIIDPSKLGISDETVAGLKDQAGRQIGLQYSAAQDDLVRRAEAAGNVNPLSLSGARERLLRSSAIDQADAVTNADLSAREAQRQANLGIADRRMTANTTLGNMGQAGAQFSGAQRVGAQQQLGTAGMGAESEIGNAGLNTNLSLAGLRTGTESAYGTLGANVGATSNAQNTAAITAAGDTAIKQAGYQDTANAARSAATAANRQSTNQANQGAKYQQGYNTSTALSGANKAIGDARIQGQQAARNYWQGQGQYQGAQMNAASASRISGAQTSLSGQGQGGQIASSTEVGRRQSRPITIGSNGIQIGI